MVSLSHAGASLRESVHCFEGTMTFLWERHPNEDLTKRLEKSCIGCRIRRINIDPRAKVSLYDCMKEAEFGKGS